MDKELIEKLENIASDFENISGKINNSAYQRKKHSENSVKFLESIEETAHILFKEIKFIGKESILIRNKHNAVLNICKILLMNLYKQSEILDKLGEMKILSSDLIGKVIDHNKMLEGYLRKGISFLEEIIEKSNEMILLDNLIQTSKKYQIKHIQFLKKSLNTAVREAENSISEMGTMFKSEKQLLSDLVEIRKNAQLPEKTIIEAAEKASERFKVISEVNKSSSIQEELTKEILMYTRQLHSESLHIKDLTVKKHSMFKDNLEPIAEIAVLIAVEFCDYLVVHDIISKIDIENKIYPEKILELLYDFISFITSCCAEIEAVVNLNYDMTEAIALNARLEEKLVELAGHELESYSPLRNEAEKTNEAAKYSVEGSSKNMLNIKEIERILKKLLPEAK